MVTDLLFPLFTYLLFLKIAGDHTKVPYNQNSPSLFQYKMILKGVMCF